MKIILLFYVIVLVAADYNVLFVIIDDLRAEIGPYRNQTVQFTPNLDAFAQQAVTFKYAYSNVALCGPSRASLFTGRTPRSLDYFQHNLEDVSDDRIIKKSPIRSLPKLFQQLGYRTIGAGKVFHRDANLDEFQESMQSKSIPCECRENCPKMICHAEEEELTDTAVVEYSLSKLQSLHRSGNKFFMSLGIRKPHLPYRVPQRSVDRIKEIYGENLEDLRVPSPKERGEVTSVSNYQCEAMDQYLSAVAADASLEVFSTQIGSEPADDFLLKKLKLGYFAAVNWADELFGRVDKKLQELDLYDNTVVAVFADNGFSLGEQGNFCKNNNFEIGTKVPLFLRYPGIDEGKVSQSMVTLLDLYPSILDLALESKSSHPLVREAKRHLHGRSFKQEITAVEEVAASKDDLAFSGIIRCWDSANRKLLDCDRKRDINVIGFSVRSREFRYTEWREFKGYSFDSKVIERQLFDHTGDVEQFPDKMETLNLIPFVSRQSDALPEEVRFSKEYLRGVVDFLSNHLEAHFSCDSLNCIEISATFAPSKQPTLSPTKQPTLFPSEKPSPSPTRLSIIGSPTTNTGQQQAQGSNNSPAVAVAITIVILLACMAIASLIIVFAKLQEASATQESGPGRGTFFREKK